MSQQHTAATTFMSCCPACTSIRGHSAAAPGLHRQALLGRHWPWSVQFQGQSGGAPWAAHRAVTCTAAGSCRYRSLLNTPT